MNQKLCSICNGKMEWLSGIPCIRCNGTGYISIPECKRCNDTGLTIKVIEVIEGTPITSFGLCDECSKKTNKAEDNPEEAQEAPNKTIWGVTRY